jgi:hypothetical protein
VSTETVLLPDPRRYHDGPAGHPLLRLALGGAAEYDALKGEICAHIRSGDDAQILEALRCAPSHAAYSSLWQAVCAAGAAASGDDRRIVAQLFAIPLVLVAGAKSRVVMPGAVPDAAAVCALLQKHAALGAMRNLGMGDALCSYEALERVTPAVIYRWSTDFAESAMERDLEACTIEVLPGREQVHLRFLVGAGIVRGAGTVFPDGAAGINAWGMSLTRLLAQQLAQPGLELLPLPRPPVPLLGAAHLGRSAQLGTAFDLFVSNGVRLFRASVGDPQAVISAHRDETGGAEIRISLSSAFDASMLEGFRWPLHPLDDLDQILCGITGLLRECRVGDVRVAGTLMPHTVPGGGMFMRAADCVQPAAAVRVH